MHRNSCLIFNYSVLDFEHFLFVDELGTVEVLNRVREYWNLLQFVV